MKLKTFAAALAATTIAGSAIAADLPSRKVAPIVAAAPVPTWTGFYIGINAGGAFGGSGGISTLGTPTFANPAFLAGGGAVAGALARLLGRAGADRLGLDPCLVGQGLTVFPRAVKAIR